MWIREESWGQRAELFAMKELLMNNRTGGGYWKVVLLIDHHSKNTTLIFFRFGYMISNRQQANKSE